MRTGFQLHSTRIYQQHLEVVAHSDERTVQSEVAQISAAMKFEMDSSPARAYRKIFLRKIFYARFKVREVNAFTQRHAGKLRVDVKARTNSDAETCSDTRQDSEKIFRRDKISVACGAVPIDGVQCDVPSKFRAHQRENFFVDLQPREMQITARIKLAAEILSAEIQIAVNGTFARAVKMNPIQRKIFVAQQNFGSLAARDIQIVAQIDTSAVKSEVRRFNMRIQIRRENPRLDAPIKIFLLNARDTVIDFLRNFLRRCRSREHERNYRRENFNGKICHSCP